LHYYYFFRSLVIWFTIACVLTSCAPHHTPDGPPDYYVDVNTIPNAVPHKLPRGAYGNPHVYVIEGRRYHVLNSSYGYFKRGVASWYGKKFHGRLTASREPYDLYGMTAASTDLPIPSFVRVTNLANKKSVIVKVNDRGPFAANRIIDLSYAAAVKLGYASKGTASVTVEAIDVDTHYAHHDAHHTLPSHLTPVLLASTDKGPHQYLQLGAFRNFHHAIYLKSHIEAFVHKPVVILKGLYHHETPLYRVLVGPLLNTSESSRLHLQSQLKKLGFTKLITVTS